MDTLGYFTQELVLQHFKNLKLDMGGMNLVAHAIVVVTIGLVTSRTVVVIAPVVVMLLLVINCKIKMNCKLAFKCITLLQIKTCFMLKVSPELPPLK